MTHVMEGALVVIQSEEQGPDAVVVLRDAVSADHAVRGLPMLHLHPPARAAQVRLVGSFRDDPVLTQPGLVREPFLGRREVLGPGREEKVRPGVEIVEILRRLADVQARAQLREPLPTLDEWHRRRSVSPSSNRSKMIKVAGISAESFLTRDSAGCSRS